MAWVVLLHDDFVPEFEAMPESVQDEIAAMSRLLGHAGPQLGRPHADTLAGSSYANMKELRFKAADGVWRIAFAFDPRRQAILLVGGDKSGVNEKRFYRSLIDKADRRFADHLKRVEEGKHGSSA